MPVRGTGRVADLGQESVVLEALEGGFPEMSVLDDRGR